jgi:hypothetical protein
MKKPALCILMPRALLSVACVLLVATAAAPELPGQKGRRPGGKWQVERSSSAMDDSPTVFLWVRAERPVAGWLEELRPILAVRCKEGSLDVYMKTGTSFSVDRCGDDLDKHGVRIRLDKGKASSQCWNESTSGDALFSPSGRTMTLNIAASETVLIEFTPFNASPVVARFDVSGFDAHRPKLNATCPLPTTEGKVTPFMKEARRAVDESLEALKVVSFAMAENGGCYEIEDEAYNKWMAVYEKANRYLNDMELPRYESIRLRDQIIDAMTAKMAECRQGNP